ncbi:MAG TPA: hypothetical protein VG015_05930 [Candidatus Dormibacteraeota bacterium]|jgi:hypothetical protein|nr:hypothetical protein [Candidatus Dormibacteraeota bacterium]
MIPIGILLILAGLVWLGQGVGLVKGSFMTGESIWAVIGAALIVVGAGVVGLGLRRRSVKR